MFKDYFAVFDELWTHALSLKDAKTKDFKTTDRRQKP
jgi:hypothetical protein